MLSQKLSFSKSIRLILVASIAGWIPNLISIIGSQLGVIVVNGSQGANQAGLYFIAFSIVAALLGIMSVLSAITYPALSAMYDGRKRLAWRMLKLTLIIILPASSSIMFYSKDIMQIFGQHYVEGYSSLEILVISVLPTSVAGFITVLVYSYGNYKQVMAIGLALTIPRVASYFILVPFYGGVGAGYRFCFGFHWRVRGLNHRSQKNQNAIVLEGPSLIICHSHGISNCPKLYRRQLSLGNNHYYLCILFYCT